MDLEWKKFFTKSFVFLFEINFPLLLKPQEAKQFIISVNSIPVYESKKNKLQQNSLFQPTITFFWRYFLWNRNFFFIISKLIVKMKFTNKLFVDALWRVPSMVVCENDSKVRYTMASRYEVPLPPPCLTSLFVTFHCPQPVKVSSMFIVKMTIVNLSPRVRYS
jgi:hypothetical protein